MLLPTDALPILLALGAAGGALVWTRIKSKKSALKQKESLIESILVRNDPRVGQVLGSSLLVGRVDCR
jgi:hypothetical protein